MHPHSGIATVTVIFEGSMDYSETTGAAGTLYQGGVEFMSAGGGVWHDGGPGPTGGVTGFQLWLALPAQDELGAAHSHYAAADEIVSSGPARVILGSYGNAVSPIRSSAGLTYLHVKLADGERWTYTPPPGHSVAWLAPGKGALLTAGVTVGREVAVFEEGDGAISVVAQGDTEFVLGSAVKHPHDLVLGYYSVHTSQAALDEGEAGIRRIAEQLQKDGKLAA
jgi:redox-sensitive bicupin YhaK (pirin superfamily)